MNIMSINYTLLRKQHRALEDVSNKEAGTTRQHLIGIENTLSALLEGIEEEYINELPEFLQFIDTEFDKTEATLEEKAEFAFGSIQEAIEGFERMEEETKEGKKE